MENTRVTKKDRFNAIITALTAAGADAELVAFCEAEIALLEKKAATAKAAAAKRKAESDELMDVVAEALTDEPTTIADITAKIDGADVTNAKVQYRLNKLVEAGIAVKSEVSVAGIEGGKTRKLVAYAKAN
jgi:hypothetical protein